MKVYDFVDEFYQLPSKTGKDVIDLEIYAKLPRVKTYGDVLGFLEMCRKSNEVNALFIVAEWGEGKTSIYEGLLKKPEVIGSDIVIPVSMKRLITVINELSQQFYDVKSIGIRFFACLLCAIKDVIETDLAENFPFNQISIRHKRPDEATMKFIADGLRSIYNILEPNSRVYVFLDEFEDLLDESQNVQDYVRRGLLEVIDGFPKCLCGKGLYAGRFHLLIAATPAAYHKFVSVSHAVIGKLRGQRILDVELEKLDRRDAYNYILGILRYSWKDKLPRIPFNKAGMFNAIYTTTLGNPRAIVNVIEILLTHPSVKEKGRIRVICPDQFISILSGRKIQVYGGDVKILDEKELRRLYAKVEQKCEQFGINKEKCIALLNTLLANLSPISEERIKDELGIKENFSAYLSIIRQSFEELWDIEPFLFFKMAMKGMDEVFKKAEAPDAPSNLSKLIEVFEFYEFTQNMQSFERKLFVPYKKLVDIEFEDRTMYRNFVDLIVGTSPELRDENQIRVLIDTHIFDKVERSDENYMMLSPAAFNIFYPSPSMFYLDFIDDLSKRFEVGMETIRNLANYEREFYEGILQLLKCKSVGRNVRVEGPIYERHGPKDVEVIEIYSTEIAGEYSIRARVMPILRIVQSEIESELKRTVDEMKEAGIPLLLVFSWNPLPVEVKGVLETYLSPEKDSPRIFYYVDFPLTTLQCQQVVGCIIARRNNYAFREEKWEARASRILDELKFDIRIKDFISKGLNQGYTLKGLQLSELSSKDVPGLIRTLLITEGSLKERYDQLVELREKFQIYGKDFPVCPKDIESMDQFRRFINELSTNGLAEISADQVSIKLSNIERRILSVLQLFRGSLDYEKIGKFFVSFTTTGMTTSKLDIYLDILMEKQRISYDKRLEVYSLRDFRELDSVFRDTKKRLEELKKAYSDGLYGYLASIKQRDVNAILINDCINYVEDIVNNTEHLRDIPDNRERWIKGFTRFKVLMEQLEVVHSLIDKFTRELDLSFRDVSAYQIKRKLAELDKRLNSLGITEKYIKIKEKEDIENIENKIQEIKNAKYSRDDVKSKASELRNEIYQFENLYEEYRNCPVFDVKIIELAKHYTKLKNLLIRCEDKLKTVEEEERRIAELALSIRSHELFKLNIPPDESPLSKTLLDWVLQNLEVR